jgi:hypothetical protein
MYNYLKNLSKKISDPFCTIEKRITKGIPVVVLDLNSNESFEYVSIAEAARSLNVYPTKV